MKENKSQSVYLFGFFRTRCAYTRKKMDKNNRKSNDEWQEKIDCHSNCKLVKKKSTYPKKLKCHTKPSFVCQEVSVLSLFTSRG